jgi:exosortase
VLNLATNGQLSSAQGEVLNGDSAMSHQAKRVRLYLPLLVLCGLLLWLICCLWSQWSFYESYQYGLFVPFLMVGLCWKRWLSAPQPQQAKPKLWAAALIIVAAAIFLLPARMIHEANSLWPTITWPMGLGVAAISLCWVYLLGGGPWLRHFSFPILFLLTALPWPGSVENRLSLPFSRFNTKVTVAALVCCNIPALQMGNTIQLAAGQIGVDEACSGIRSFHSTLMLGLFLGELYRLGTASRLALLLAGILLACLGNVGRIFLLSWICAGKGSVEMAKWHDAIGTGVAAACMAGLWPFALIAKSRKTHRPGIDQRNEKTASPLRQPWPIPNWLIVFLLSLPLFVETVTRGWFRMRESSMTDMAKWSVILPAARGDFQTTDTYKVLKRGYHADEIASSMWAESDGSHWQAYYLRWEHGSKTAQAAKGHWPEFCMSNAGDILRAPPQTKVYHAGNLELPFRTYIFDRDGTLIYVFHCVWEERNGEALRIDLDLKPNLLSRLQSAWDGKRNLGQQLLEFVVEGFKDFDDAEAAFTRQLAKRIVMEKKIPKPEDKEKAEVRSRQRRPT